MVQGKREVSAGLLDVFRLKQLRGPPNRLACLRPHVHASSPAKCMAHAPLGALPQYLSHVPYRMPAGPQGKSKDTLTMVSYNIWNINGFDQVELILLLDFTV